jgi:hypothetical protein
MTSPLEQKIKITGPVVVTANAAAADDLRAVGPYVAPVKLAPGGHVRPGNLREFIRLGGPTIELPVTFGI